jgi:hypothetical protein
VNRALGALAAAAILVGGWLWWSSDARRVGARLAELQAAFEKDGPEDQLTSFGKTRRIVELFAPGFLILARPYEGSISDRQQLAAVVQRYRDSARTIDVASGSRETEVDSARGTAETTAVFSISGDRGGGGSGGERFRARIAWSRTEGEWRIQQIEILEVLERGLLGL